MEINEFQKRVEKITEAQLDGKSTMLDTGKKFHELCQEWLLTNDELPIGFEGFADKPVHS